MKKVELGNQNIAYKDQGAGEAVLLLHGFCGSSAYFDEILPELTANYRCIVPDLRGHGQSDAPNSSYSIDQMADDVIGVLNALELAKVSVFGHSLGGYITLSIAERYPERVKAFGLVHSTAYPDSEEAKEKRLAAVSTIQSKGIQNFVDSLVPGLFAEENREQMSSVIDKIQEIGYRTSPLGASSTAIAMRERPDRRHVLEKSSVPVLLIAGESDGVVPPDRTFTAEGEGVTQALIRGAGHMSMVEAPDELTRVILEFLDKNIK
ncbi:alpha/beta hydrolase [Paenibacillus polygoni]|uniref:Alpha/beta hydrolase n=1 Tax=Paenibacillus polygoni TaxID=3050112 RepID=A0ABY8X645_9BACL|nr:alpha/beta hydrolase [Paenibacillus polygoni]WIV18685.1 alpha/beta hydrolase [Paenibacillus polygoni]